MRFAILYFVVLMGSFYGGWKLNELAMYKISFSEKIKQYIWIIRSALIEWLAGEDVYLINVGNSFSPKKPVAINRQDLRDLVLKNAIKLGDKQSLYLINSYLNTNDLRVEEEKNR